MLTNYKYRMYGRSKGRGKSTYITSYAKEIQIKKIFKNKYNVIDIGVGYGESTFEIAKSDNNKNVIACERYIDGINKVAEKRLKSLVNNVSIFHGNVHQLLDEYCKKESISEIWILFPDPWPKKRHFKRRLINVSFFNKIKNYLNDDAIIHIASDSKSYISSILTTIHSIRKDFVWLNQQKEVWDYVNLPLPKTKYLQKALQKGRNPFYFKLRKL